MRHTTPNPDGFEYFDVAGRLHWRHLDSGRTGFVVSGGDNGEGEGGEGGTGDGGEGGNEPETFTQDQLNHHTGRARNEGRTTAAREMADQLGVPVEEAKRIIEAHRAAEEANQTESERALAAAQTAQAQADADRAAAAQERLAAKVERKLTAAGLVLPEKDADAALAKAVRLLALDPDADDTAITAEITTLQEQMPGLFTAATSGNPPPPPPVPGGTGAKPPPGGQAVKTAIDKGAERARQRHPQPA